MATPGETPRTQESKDNSSMPQKTPRTKANTKRNQEGGGKPEQSDNVSKSNNQAISNEREDTHREKKESLKEEGGNTKESENGSKNIKPETSNGVDAHREKKESLKEEGGNTKESENGSKSINPEPSNEGVDAHRQKKESLKEGGGNTKESENGSKSIKSETSNEGVDAHREKKESLKEGGGNTNQSENGSKNINPKPSNEGVEAHREKKESIKEGGGNTKECENGSKNIKSETSNDGVDTHREKKESLKEGGGNTKESKNGSKNIEPKTTNEGADSLCEKKVSLKVSGSHDSKIPIKHDSTGKQPRFTKAFKFIGKLSGKKKSLQPRETCVLIVNRKHVSEENERAFREGLTRNYLYKDVQEKGNEIKFHVKIDYLFKAVEAVQKMREIFSKTTVTAKDAQVVEESKPPLSQGIKKSSPGVKEKPEKLCRHLSPNEYKALEYLLGKDFTNAVKSVEKNNNGEIVSVCAKNKADKESIDHWLSHLRQESLTLTSEELGKLGGSVDTKSAGVKAFIAVQNNEGRVVIFAFDYAAIQTAKHMVNVKSEKVKINSKSKQGLDMIVRPKPAPLAQDKELYTKSGIKVAVYKADITHLPVDAIVNAANGQLNHGGGVAAVISRAAGVNLQLEGDDYVRDHGPLKVTEVLSTTAGNLPCKNVFHAVGPRWDDYQDKGLCQIRLEQTVFNCFKKAHEMKFTSLAVSSISSVMVVLTHPQTVRHWISDLAAITTHQYGSPTFSCKARVQSVSAHRTHAYRIHIELSRSSAIFGVPKEMCARMYLAGIQMFDRQHGGNTSLKNIHFVDVSDEMVGIIHKVFTQLWHGEFQPFLFLRQNKNKSKQKSKHVQVNRSKPQQSEFSKNSKRSDVGNGRHFDFKGITLFLQQQEVTDVPEDIAMVAWQEPGRLQIETDDWFKIIGSSSGESIPSFENINEGDVKTFTARNGRTILFPAMSSQTIDETKVSGMLEIILNMVQQESKRSVVIPSSPYVNQTESNTNNRLEQFCEGIYKGIQRYSENRFAYVTVDNADILEAMAEKIRLLHGEGMRVEKSRSHKEKHCIELPRITIVIKQEEAKSESVQRMMDESVRQYECKCQSEPRVCLEMKSQEVNKFIEALKHASKPHTTENEKSQVGQHQERECGDISLDRKKYDALRHLDNDFITSNFTEVNDQQAIEDSVVVNLRPNTTSHAEELKLLLNSLRIEEMKLSSDEFEKFTRSSDISPTDRDFFILSERNEGKVIVYARNYQAMTTANHIISLKTGKIKITARDQRKFSTSDPTSATSNSGDCQQSSMFDVTHNETQSTQLPSEKTGFAGEIDNSSGTRM